MAGGREMMDYQVLVDLINGVGFPIAMVAYFIWDKTKVTNQLVTAINNNNTILQKLITVIGRDDLADGVANE